MEKQPKFLKDFSRENSSDERGELSKKIRSAREVVFSKRKETHEKRTSLEMASADTDQKIEAQLGELEHLKEQIEGLSGSRVERLINYFKLRNLRRLVDETKQSMSVDKETYARYKVDLETLEKEEAEITLEFENIKRRLEKFYEDEKTKWSQAEYSKEDIVKYFCEEHLVSLSIDEYVLLLQRFPSDMVTHVTRQGIRDHVEAWDHTGGLHSYSNGFIDMLEDGRLRAPLSIYLIQKDQERAIAEYLHLDEFETEEAALENLGYVLDNYANVASLHFAAEEVADALYGSETGNEIFIAYPSAHVASQYDFYGNPTTVPDAGSLYLNDVWVWTREEDGIDVNAGIVFIPGDVPVNPETGSKYEINEKGNPIVNEEYIDLVKSFVLSNGFDDFIELSDQMYDNLPSIQGTSIERDFEIGLRKDRLREKLVAFGLKDKRLQDIMLVSSDILRTFAFYKDGKSSDGATLDSVIQKELKMRGILFTEAKETITSRDFWEDHFKRTGKKPSKIVYYSGGNPTSALHKWRSRKGIMPDVKDAGDLGFTNNAIDKDSDKALAGKDRFESIAREVIHKHFSLGQ